MKLAAAALALSLVAGCSKGSEPSKVEILNVSYDPTRELYEAIDTSFIAQQKTKSGLEVIVRQSHAGSGKQARSVIDGLEADVVTLGLSYDIDAIAKSGLLPENWKERAPNASVPFYSTIVFVVRSGNPKHIVDWADLARDGVSVITANPKTSGGARWAYVAAWGAELERSNDEAKARALVSKIYANVPVLDSGARGATTTFVERGLGDVLISWENEALLAAEKIGAGKVEVVTPSVSVRAEPPVAVVDKVVDRRGTRAVAEAYVSYLFTDEAQTIAAKNHYRPTSEAVKKVFAGRFPDVRLFDIDKRMGGWASVHKTHFDDGGIFDQIYAKAK
jgi:sulfate transport system substrate-binding protein